MNLMDIKDIALKYSEAISIILDIDVIIIDSKYNRIANTIRHVTNHIPIRRLSVVGEVLSTGKVIIIENTGDYELCKNCNDMSECAISGMISVPIFFDNKVIGVIALLVPKNKTSPIFNNVEPAIDFLESMADLMGFKLKNIEDYNKLNVAKKERETIINTIEDGLVAFNDEEKVIYYNNRFLNFFKIDKEIYGLSLAEIIDHSLIKEMLMVPYDVSYKSFYYEEKNHSFFGLVSKRTIALNGKKYGSLLIFSNINKNHKLLNSVLDDRDRISFDSILGEDIKLISEINRAKKLAVTSENILIFNKPGFDSSVLARAIHNFSDRSEENFEIVDCSNTSFEALEKDIFGSGNEGLEGKLTIGKLRISQNGTIFFKNIDEMPPYIQKRLLQVMKTKEIKCEIYDDFNLNSRMIFHSNSDLLPLVVKGFINEELYYRISGNIVTIPELAKRTKDIKIIVNHVISQLKIKYLKPNLQFDEDVLEMLYKYNWPNNIQEIEKTIGIIINNSYESVVRINDIYNFDFYRGKEKVTCTVEDMEKELIEKMMLEYKNKDDIANAMGIGRATLYRKLKKYGIN